MRIVIIIALYAVTFICIHAGMTMAPDMKWPHSQLEFTAASLLIMGTITSISAKILLLARNY